MYVLIKVLSHANARRKRTGWRVTNLSLLLVVFKWHRGSEGVNYTIWVLETNFYYELMEFCPRNKVCKWARSKLCIMRYRVWFQKQRLQWWVTADLASRNQILLQCALGPDWENQILQWWVTLFPETVAMVRYRNHNLQMRIFSASIFFSNEKQSKTKHTPNKQTKTNKAKHTNQPSKQAPKYRK